MILNPQIIKNGIESQYAVLPFEEFLKMKEIIEDYEDLINLRSAKNQDALISGKSAKELLLELSK